MPPSRTVSRSEWVITTRRELEHSDDGHNSDDDGDGDALRFLETLVSGNLDFSATVQSKRKKSKGKGSTITEAMPQDSTLFKLISSTPVPISLEREPIPVIIVPKLATEDTEDEAAIRHRRAMEAAVDFDFIAQQSKIPYLPRPSPNSSPAVYRLPAQTDQTLPSLFVTERSYKTSPTASLDTKTSLAKTCSIVRVRSSVTHQEPVKSGTRGKPDSPSNFFRPLAEWKGKSRGYAMGYEGSWAVQSYQRNRYTRDRMAKGVVEPAS
ncbi:hypothetical protein SISSUDRAFT_349073 [Sistotremastrum suecicum HHB10207 ss-3]|uniref:Uncharacterized protein n=1 Tax=Sistotremastrum suecicum HHB10207 ss-3 TaxID=1314776 RepID=A0A166G1Q3_9AGAM|nr:hypothetical protein SISSUDRAFT_349073 [Sistotremastrum suecicum HHB10207 ss-3]